MQKNKQMQKNKRQNVKNVRSVIRQTVTGYAGLSLGIVLAVAGAIVTALCRPGSWEVSWIRSPQETQFRLHW